MSFELYVDEKMDPYFQNKLEEHGLAFQKAPHTVNFEFPVCVYYFSSEESFHRADAIYTEMYFQEDSEENLHPKQAFIDYLSLIFLLLGIPFFAWAAYFFLFEMLGDIDDYTLKLGILFATVAAVAAEVYFIYALKGTVQNLRNLYQNRRKNESG